MKLLVAALVSALTLLLPATAGARPACFGHLDPDGTCHVHDDGPDYTVDIGYPTDYPDQGRLTDFVERQRDEFVGWATETPGPAQKSLDIVADEYRSGSATSGTRSVVLTIGADTGVHPVTTYETFTYDLEAKAPITIENLFKPGAEPLTVLNPIVDRETNSANELLTLDGYRDFALTDDAVTFFFAQDGLLPHEAGPLTVAVPRTQLAGMLA
ncbi:MAG: RsiV family protein [Mycobacterium sp.]